MIGKILPCALSLSLLSVGLTMSLTFFEDFSAFLGTLPSPLPLSVFQMPYKYVFTNRNNFYYVLHYMYIS